LLLLLHLQLLLSLQLLLLLLLLLLPPVCLIPGQCHNMSSLAPLLPRLLAPLLLFWSHVLLF
jgi:hypothetical protein